jgi:proteasome activator subunit 4
MILDILDQIGSPILEKLDALMDTTEKWDHVARNDFCR